MKRNIDRALMRAIVLPIIATVLSVAGARAQSPDGASWQAHTTVSADGARIAYYTLGPAQTDAPPLIVISGGPGSDHRYMRLGGAFKTLARDRRIVMFDQRGTGQSDDVEDAPTIEMWADDVDAIRRALNAKQADLLGHSFGGFVMMATLERYNKSIRRLIFVDAPAPRLADTKSLLRDLYPDRAEAWFAQRAELDERIAARTLALFFSMEFVDPALGAMYPAAVGDYIYNLDVNNRLRVDLADRDYANTLQNAMQPALVLHGRFDAIIAPSVAWSLHEILPNAEIAFIEKASHMPFVEQPDAFASAVERFLNKPESGLRK